MERKWADGVCVDNGVFAGLLSDDFQGTSTKGAREHAVGKDKSQPNIKVCQVWTDTWLKRGGTWQIIASHDNRVKCK
jgi:hypothetical protein